MLHTHSGTPTTQTLNLNVLIALSIDDTSLTSQNGSRVPTLVTYLDGQCVEMVEHHMVWLW